MKKLVLALLFLTCGHYAATAKKYIVYFADKGNAQFRAADVTSALAPVAIEKRKANGLGFDHYDLPVNDAYLQQISGTGVTILRTSRWLNAALVESDMDLQQLQKASGRHADRVVPIHEAPAKANKFTGEFSAVQQPTPKPQSRTTSAINYGDAAAQNLLYGIDYLHDKGYTGKGITVCFLDAGYTQFDVNPAFDSLRARNAIKATFDFWGNVPDVYGKDSHGSFCAAFLAGNMPGTYVGMAPDVDVMLGITDDLVSETHQDEFSYIAGVEWAEAHGADVISASISYRDFDPGEGDYSLSDMDGKTSIASQGARIAAAKGIILVNAAGNGGIICTPCDVDSILCVGGAKNDKSYDDISSFGPTGDGRLKPDVGAQTRDVFSVAPNGTTFGNSYGGTSSATPQIAGLAACLKQANPTANNYQIIQAIKKSAHNADFPDIFTGYGVPNAKAADDSLRIMLSVKEVKQVASFNIYPNPASNIAYIESKDIIHAVTLTSLTGQVVYRALPGSFVAVVDLSCVPSGSYVISVQTEKGNSSSLLLKQ